MAQGFYGADPEQLRALAKQFSSGSNQIRSSLETVSSLVNSTQSWQGPDAGAFQQRWNSQVKQLGNTVVHALELGSTTLIKNADEQTATSQVDGGAGGNGGPGGNGSDKGPGPGTPKSPSDPGFFEPGSSFRDAWSKYGNLTTYADLWKVARGTTDWGFRGLPMFAGNTAPYRLLDSMADVIKLDNLNKYIPALNISDDVLNSSTGLMGVKNGVLNFVGEGGLGKGLGALGVGLDAYDAVTSAAKGEYGDAAWSATKAALGAASFLPPPAGTVAGVVSLGIAVYEIPAVKEFVDNGAKAVADTVSNAVKDPGKFANDVANNLKDAGEGVKNFLGL
ncbi:WXG100 family type VII secretion target [Agreia pratensis]|uniref:Uncharacterized conserved protein YukE n=1 Tax=Agreia pratensis TaxID=150121 RepID=A0A1X7JMH8_9MICO|nr:WXG100 family type VII secretion target [Agreia pratensis]SMG28628.1 Uncharacterized conserved protein YukE [Agreia pratensis]